MKFVPSSSPGNSAGHWPDGIASQIPGLSVQTLQLIFVLVAIAFTIFAFIQFLRARKKASWRTRKSNWRKSNGYQSTKPQLHTVPAHTPNMADPTEQMRAISKVDFERSRLLNKEEARLLPLLETIARQAKAGHRIMAQTSLGEVLKPRKESGSATELRNAFASINSKRLDFAVIDRAGFIVCAVEYQGSGHFQGNAFMRDSVKREALRRAKIPFIEVPKNFDPVDIKKSIGQILHPETHGSQHRHTTVHV